MAKLSFNPDRVIFRGTEFMVYDVSDKLPRHKNFPHGTDVVKPNGKRAVPAHWKFKFVPDRKIHVMYNHQTAGSTKISGFSGLINSFAFMSRDPAYTEAGKWTGRGRGWPGGGYTYFNPFRPVIFEDRYVIFKCWDHGWVTWHSSDNHHSEAIVNQGYFRHPSIRTFRPKPGCPDGEPSESQQIALRGFLTEYAIGELGIPKEGLRGHCDSPHPKKACPGTTTEKIYRSIRAGEVEEAIFELPDEAGPMFPEIEGLLELGNWYERQAALVLLGHNIGKYGNKKNGVDGDPGDMTRAAIETEEENLGLTVDGYWDDTFDYHVKLQLAARLKTQEDLDALI